MPGDSPKQMRFAFESSEGNILPSAPEEHPNVQQGNNRVVRSLHRVLKPRKQKEVDPLQRWHQKYFKPAQIEKIRSDFHRLYVLSDVEPELDPKEKMEVFRKLVSDVSSGEFASWITPREISYVRETKADTYPEVKLKSVTADFLRRSLNLMKILDNTATEVFEEITKKEREVIRTIYHGNIDEWLAARGFKLMAEELQQRVASSQK